jgi:hypothetical protein
VRFAPRSVITGWLVPGLNLIRPKQIVDDLWRASHPLAPPLSSSWRVGPTTAWSAAWWSGLLVGLLLGVTTKFVQPAGAINSATGQAPMLALAASSALLLAGSTLCLRLLVRRIGERQDTRSVFVLGRGAELDAVETPEPSGVARDERPVRPALLVQPASRDVVYGKY